MKHLSRNRKRSLGAVLALGVVLAAALPATQASAGDLPVGGGSGGTTSSNATQRAGIYTMTLGVQLECSLAHTLFYGEEVYCGTASATGTVTAPANRFAAAATVCARVYTKGAAPSGVDEGFHGQEQRCASTARTTPDLQTATVSATSWHSGLWFASVRPGTEVCIDATMTLAQVKAPTLRASKCVYVEASKYQGPAQPLDYLLDL